MNSAEPFVIGEIVGAFGTGGELRVQALTDFPDRFQRLKQVTVAMPNGTRTLYRVLRCYPHETKELVVVRLQGVTTRAAAQRLVGGLLEIPPEEAVELPPDTYFAHDILGLQVVTTDGRKLGAIQEILRTGANDVYVTPTCLIPAIEQVVRQVDLESGTMVVEPIPGLLDDDAD